MENVLLNEFTLLESLGGIGFVISASFKCQLNSLQCFASTNPVDVGKQACSYCTCIRQHSQMVQDLPGTRGVQMLSFCIIKADTNFTTHPSKRCKEERFGMDGYGANQMLPRQPPKTNASGRQLISMLVL